MSLHFTYKVWFGLNTAFVENEYSKLSLLKPLPVYGLHFGRVNSDDINGCEIQQEVWGVCLYYINFNIHICIYLLYICRE